MDPSTQLSQGYCIVEWDLYFEGKGGGGPAVVRAGSSAILTLDMDAYYSTGSEGDQFGERYLVVSPPIGILPNTTITLDLSGCPYCDSLTVTFGAAPR